MKEDIQTVSLKLLNKSDEGTTKFIKLQIFNENEVREEFFTSSRTYRCSMFINGVARKHRKYLNDQDHSQMSNLGSKVGNLFGSFSASLGNII